MNHKKCARELSDTAHVWLRNMRYDSNDGKEVSENRRQNTERDAAILQAAAAILFASADGKLQRETKPGDRWDIADHLTLTQREKREVA